MRELLKLGSKFAKSMVALVIAAGFVSSAYSMTTGMPGGNGGAGASNMSNTGPKGNGTLVLPGDIKTSSKKYPIMIWGPGMGTTPSLYSSIMRQFASAGMVVYSQVSSGNGSEMKAAIDWLVKQNDNPSSPVYKKLDTSKVGVGGHSLGGMSSFTASGDARVKTAVLAAGGSFIPGGRRGLTKPTLMVGGTSDFATSAMQGDYQKATGAVFMTVLKGAGHAGIPFQASDMMTSWLRWQLLGQADRKNDFIGTNCKYCGGGETKTKNL